MSAISNQSTIVIYLGFEQRLVPIDFEQFMENFKSVKELLDFSNYRIVKSIPEKLSPINPGMKLVFIWESSPNLSIEHNKKYIDSMSTVVHDVKYKGRAATILETIIYGIHFAGISKGTFFSLGEHVEDGIGQKNYIFHKDDDDDDLGRMLGSSTEILVRNISNRFLVVFDEVIE